MITLRYRSKVISFPELEDINWEKFMGLKTAETDLDAFRVMNCGVDELDDSEDSFNLVSAATLYLDNLKAEIQAFEKETYAVPLLIGSTTIPTPDSIGHISFGASRYVKGLIKQMGEEPFLQYADYPGLVGHYVYETVVRKPYDEYKAEQFSQEFIKDQVGFRVIILLGDFFLLRHADYWNTKMKCLSLKAQVWLRQRAPKFLTSSTT